MFDNIGSKIMGLAKFIFYLEVFVSIIGGIATITIGANSWTAEYLVYVGVAEIILGPIFAWISAFVLYGYGELIEQTTNTANNTRAISRAIKAYDIQEPNPTEIFRAAAMNRTTKNCPHCGEIVTSSKCATCGRENNLFNSQN